MERGFCDITFGQFGCRKQFSAGYSLRPIILVLVLVLVLDLAGNCEDEEKNNAEIKIMRFRTGTQ